MIKIEKIDKYFNRFKRNQIHVINNTSLEFGDNGLVALLGPSGSGKTTLLNVIGRLDKVRRGKIYINGRKITQRFQGCIRISGRYFIAINQFIVIHNTGHHLGATKFYSSIQHQ